MNKAFLLIFVLFFGRSVHARKYKYYLDPRNAETVLAGIALKGRISSDEWLKIIQNQKNATYTVQLGDNLWNISRKLFGDAWLWRKVWQMNQGIFNPHELDTGRVLAYYNEAASEGEWRIPVVKLSPDKKGNANDLDNDKFVNIDIKQKHRISHFLLDEEEVLGEITGSYSPKTIFGIESDLYLNFHDKKNVKVGDTYMIAREERFVRDLGDPSNSVSGTLMVTVGEVKVVQFGQELVRAEIVSLFDTMRREDKIIKIDKTSPWQAAMHPPKELSAKIAYGEYPHRKMFGEGSLVLLDRGTEAGMKTGFLFRVFQDTDPVLNSKDAVEPHYKGEIQIVYAGKNSSLGFITKSKDPIVLGDTAVPSQTFEDPPPPETHPNDSVEID